MSSPLWKSLPALAAVMLFATTAPAAAQICGDADGGGSVTVTDGVQTLRAAAGLSSSCTEATCDIDGNGTITVTDGVNVLRIAAGLSVTLSCPGGVDGQVQNLLQSSLPIFGNLTKIGTSSSASARAADTQTEPCDNADGSATVTTNPDEIDFVFRNCDSGGLKADGSLALTSNALGFNITFTDLSTGESEFLNGSISQESDGQTIFTSGSFTLADSEFGSFGITFDQLVLDPNTLLFVGGALEFSVQSGQLGAITRVALAFDPSNVAFVEVDLADGEMLPFSYDLKTGDLTPAPN